MKNNLFNIGSYLPAKITGREKIFIIVCIFALLATVFYKFGIGPLLDSSRNVREEIEIKEMVLLKYRKAIRNKKEIQENMASLEKYLRVMGVKFLKGETASLAAADLQDTLKKIAVSNGIEIRSAKILSPGEGEIYRKISVQVEINCTIAQLRDFIYDIETYRQFLTIPRLSIRVFTRTRGKTRKQARTSLAITGFMKKL